MVVKVKELLLKNTGFLFAKNSLLFTYLHMAAAPGISGRYGLQLKTTVAETVREAAHEKRTVLAVPSWSR